MRRKLVSLCICAFVFSPVTFAADLGWSLDEKVDPLTDQKVITAISSHAEGVSKRSIIVRGRGTDIEVFFAFDEYLGNDDLTIRYRVDKGPLVEEKWPPSATGTAVAAWFQSVDLARLLMHGSTFIIEVLDYRGQPHRATFDLKGSSAVIGSVLNQCGVPPHGLERQIEGLRREIALNIEFWRPETVSENKRALTSSGDYDGPIDTSIEPEFALAVQRLYDRYVSRCRDGLESGTYCTLLKTWRSLGRKPRVDVDMVIYELKKKAGDF